MKLAFALIVLASATLTFAQDAPAPATLKPGDAVSFEAIAGATWIQGEPQTDWEPGKVYMLECWATWCGPCVRMIPHVNELHKEYADKGLRVIAMNVWEDGQEKVSKFVSGKGEAMSYPVAYVGRGGMFEKQWLKAAGVRGIPHAFVVKDGKLLFRSHPASISKEMIEALLAGGEAEQKLIQEIADRQSRGEKLNALRQEFVEAAKVNNAEAMAKTIAEMEKIAPEDGSLMQMKLDHAIATSDWEKAGKMTSELAGKPGAIRVMRVLALRAQPSGVAASPLNDCPDEYRKAIADGLEKSMDDTADAMSYVILASLRLQLGDKDAAKAAASKAVEKHGRLPVEPLEAYLKSIEDGSPQTLAEVGGAVNKAIQDARKAPPAKPAE